MAADLRLLRELFEEIGLVLGLLGGGEREKGAEGGVEHQGVGHEEGARVQRKRGSRYSADCARDIVETLAAVAKRLTLTQLGTELALRGRPWCHTVVASTAAEMRRRGELTNREDERGAGYGLPTWGSRLAG